MSHIYDEHETIAGLRAVVAERGPEYVYERIQGTGFVCIYWDRAKDCPSCLVGHLLARFGFTNLPAFIEGKSVDAAIWGSLDRDSEFATFWRERFTVPALRLLSAAQTEQDAGATWGSALRTAEAAYAMWSADRRFPNDESVE